MQNFVKKLYAGNQILLIVTLIVLADCSVCHYSCKNCTTNSYFNCFSCSDPSFSFTVTQSTSFINSIYLKSIYDVGICVGKVPSGVNSLGVLLIIFGLLCLIFFRNFQVFYIYCTLQTLGLFSLVQIAWLNPSNYILQSFQYLMPINLILSNLKSEDYMLEIFGYFRLDKYMIDLQITLAVVLFVLNIIIFTFVILFWKMSRQKQQQLQYEKQKMQITQSSILQSNEKQQKQATSNHQNMQENSIFYSYFYQFFPLHQFLNWKNALHISLYLFFLIIQETMLTIMIQVVFQTTIFVIAVWVVYFFIIFTLFLISFNQWNKQKKQQMKLFLSIPCMIINWLKKIILPIVIVLPVESQIILFILYPLLALVQAYYDSKSKKYGCFSRMFVYKLIQTILMIALLIYYVNQAKGKTYSNSLIVAIVVFILSLLFMLAFIVEVPIGIFSIISSASSQNKNQIQLQQQKQKYREQLNKQDTIDMENIFQPQRQRPTLQIIDMQVEQIAFQKPKQQIQNRSPKNIKLQKLEHEHKIFNSYQPQVNKNPQQTNLIQVKAKINQALKQQQKSSQINKEMDKLIEIQKKIKDSIQPSNKTIDTINVDEIDENHQQKKIIQKIQQAEQIDINGKNEQIQKEQDKQENQNIDEKDQNNQSKKKKKKRERILDPQLRKRYGLK